MLFSSAEVKKLTNLYFLRALGRLVSLPLFHLSEMLSKKIIQLIVFWTTIGLWYQLQVIQILVIYYQLTSY